jgi:hypothetical protein
VRSRTCLLRYLISSININRMSLINYADVLSLSMRTHSLMIAMTKYWKVILGNVKYCTKPIVYIYIFFLPPRLQPCRSGSPLRRFLLRPREAPNGIDNLNLKPRVTFFVRPSPSVLNISSKDRRYERCQIDTCFLVV